MPHTTVHLQRCIGKGKADLFTNYTKIVLHTRERLPWAKLKENTLDLVTKWAFHEFAC